jgi:DNA repair protein RadC
MEEKIMKCKSEDVVKYDAGAGAGAEDIVPVFEARICLKGDRSTGRQITNAESLKKYIRETMSEYATETLMVVSVDTQCRVLSTAIVGVGGLDSVDVDIASIAKVALLSNARGVFLSHNHPGGTCRPSSADITSTLQIKQALAMFRIEIMDHIIICPDGSSYSMRQHGDF